MQNAGTLEIRLEEVGDRSWWRRLLATFAAPNGSAYLRFVGHVDGEVRYRGATFTAPRTVGPAHPQEPWAPGMTQALRSVCDDVEADGWTLVGRGEQPWMLRYDRGLTPSSV